METKDYESLMCQYCLNKDKCNKTKIYKKEKDGMITFKCKNYISNYQKKNGFVYKNQLFQY